MTRIQRWVERHNAAAIARAKRRHPKPPFTSAAVTTTRRKP